MPTVIPVRMHFCSQDLWFDPGDTGATKGDHVVVTTERGTEFGLVTADSFEAPSEEVKGELKPVLRVATEEDLEKADELAERGEQAMSVFRELVKAAELDMKPVGVEFLFGGEKVVFYFAAEDRVDFRDLVRELAAHFHQRVDMRQIGVRDEARLIGGYAPCGQELCCVRFGSDFEPVSIRMAKEQDLPLNSSKISGVCGRLMCCLRYEFEAYRDFKQRAPKKNAVIDTPLGKAKIVEYNTPRETLRLRLENGKSFVVALKDMTCSEGCCKRSAEQHIPLRPDTVTREALEQLGTADIAMQLAELDRASDPGGAYHLDDSLLEGHRTPRKRSQAAAPNTEKLQGRRQKGQHTDAAENPETARTPRRRAGRTAGQAAPEKTPQQQTRRQRKGTPAAPETAQTPEQQGRPRAGGMRPRRANKANQQQVPQNQARQDREQRSAASTTEAANAPQQQRRTRRHHVADASATPTAAATEHANATPAEGRPNRTRTRRPAVEGRQADANRQANAQDRRKPQGGPEGSARPRRQHRSAEGSPQGGAQKPNAPEQRTSRRRRPGDHGGTTPERSAD